VSHYTNTVTVMELEYKTAALRMFGRKAQVRGNGAWRSETVAQSPSCSCIPQSRNVTPALLAGGLLSVACIRASGYNRTATLQGLTVKHRAIRAKGETMTEQRVQSQSQKQQGISVRQRVCSGFTYSQDDATTRTRRQALDMVAQGTKQTEGDP